MLETKRPLKVFLSHASIDTQKVRELYRYLKRLGIQPWFSGEDLVGGDDWRVEIQKALETSDIIIICLTKNSVNKKGFIEKEIRFALDKALEMPDERFYLIPVRFEECEVPLPLSQYHWVDLLDEDGYVRLMRALRIRADKVGATLQLAEQLNSKKPQHTQSEYSNKEKKPVVSRKDQPKALPLSDIEVGGDVSGSVVVAGNNNVINMPTRGTKGLLGRLPKEKSISGERVLEAAIEKQVNVGKPASLFVWVRRHESKNIISVVSSIDEYVRLDEENVKTKDLEIEFPVENGKTLPAEITLRLVAYEFIPSKQQKEVNIPPNGDSEVCTFIVTPKQSGELLLSLEVLKNEISLANRNLRTTAIDIEKKVDNTLVLVSIPIIVLVQTTTSMSSETTTVKGGELIEVERQAKVRLEEERMARQKLEAERQEKGRLSKERLMAERIESEKMKKEKSYSEKNERARIPSKNSRSPEPSPIIAALLSIFMFGGAGQIYIGQVAKGIVIIITSLILLCFGIGIIIWFVGCIDAYILADRKRKGEVIKEWQWFWE